MWINDSSQTASFLKGGYYKVKTKHGILIVGLNTNLYYTSDKLTENIEDPADQFVWLENTLKVARSNQAKVLITGHVPPGIKSPSTVMWMYPKFNTRLNNIFLAYSDIIIGMHFGHEHDDNFRVYYKYGKAVMSVFCAPSVTTWRFKIPGETGPPHNPGVRLIKYDRTSGRHLDLIQYYMDLPATNTLVQPKWMIEYIATRDYGINDITPVSMDKLIRKMSNPDSTEFENYRKWLIVNADHRFSCDATCKASTLCSFRHFEMTPFRACVKRYIRTGRPRH